MRHCRDIPLVGTVRGILACRERSGRIGRRHVERAYFPIFQDVDRDLPPSGDDLCPLSANLAERRGKSQWEVRGLDAYTRLPHDVFCDKGDRRLGCRELLVSGKTQRQVQLELRPLGHLHLKLGLVIPRQADERFAILVRHRGKAGILVAQFSALTESLSSAW